MGLVKRREKQQLICPLCGFTKKRRTIFEKHLQEAHNKTTQELWNELNNGPGVCECGCGQETRWLNYIDGYAKFVNGHNAYKHAMKDKAEEILNKRKSTLKKHLETKEVVPWSKGLTKETDERIARRAELSAKAIKQTFIDGREAWSKGLTKETDERVRLKAEHLKNLFKTGEATPWAKGLTKETDERIAKMAQTVSITHSNKELRNKLDSMKRLSKEEIISRIEAHNFRVIDDLSNYINDKDTYIKVQCLTCKKTFIDILRRLQNGRCYYCSPGGSTAQAEVSTFVKSLGLNTEINKRGIIGHLELDIFVPDKNFAIEYNGLYWHSNLQKSNQYHNNKTKLCRKQGITLFHVFEDEWRDKQEIVKSMIRHKLNITNKVIYARKCKVVELSNKQKKDFFNSNHIDGNANSIYAIGLIINEEIVAAISIRKPFHSSINSFEISRYCTKINTHVVGGLSKLIKHSLKTYKNLITYVDTRHGNGQGYSSCNLKLIKETAPRFWWTDFHSRYNRFKFRANKGQNLTEKQVAEQAGVVKIWGCSNLIYEISL